jgi:hypothetical protein
VNSKSEASASINTRKCSCQTARVDQAEKEKTGRMQTKNGCRSEIIGKTTEINHFQANLYQQSELELSA